VSARLVLVLGVLLVVLPGCATTTSKYDWGKYDPSLYSYYKDPTKVTELYESLDAVIKAADSKRALVPPGIYAEYGYLQLQQGKSQEAVQLFRKEETHWPESKVFMDRMIQVASTPSAVPVARSPAQ
jgi:hypothetical protein